MKLKLIPSFVSAAALMAFISTTVFAGPGPAVPEPRRIYDLGSRNFIDNPDYRAPAAAPKRNPRWVQQWNERSSEPRRTYNLMTQQFEEPPIYRTPASDKTRVQRTSPR